MKRTKVNNDKPLVAKNEIQQEYIDSIKENKLVFCLGPAGVGKTIVAAGVACQMLKAGNISKILVTRPCTQVGTNLGAMPGTKEEKIDPYMVPLMEYIRDFLGADFGKHRKNIEYEALQFMRGRTFSNSFVILDEAQNCTEKELKMFLTRMTDDCKVVINGDPEQNDLDDIKRGRHNTVETDLERVIVKFEEAQIRGVDIVEMEVEDIVRGGIVRDILRIL